MQRDQKIKLDTPVDVLYNTIEKEGDKAIRWFVKQSGGEDGLKKRTYNANCDVRDGKARADEGIEVYRCVWQTEADDGTLNRWFMVRFARLFSVIDHHMVFYETEASIGIFIGFNDHFENKDYIFVFESHFFLRYCDEQHKLGKMGNDIAGKLNMVAKFMQHNPFIHYSDCYHFYKNEEGQDSIDVALSGCVGRGRYVKTDKVTVCYIKTPLTWESMSKPQETFCQTIIDKWIDHREFMVGWVDNFKELYKNYTKFDNEQLINIDRMTQEQKDELKRVLKECGVQGFGTVASYVAKNSDQYYNLAEPVFAISRLLPMFNSEIDKKRAEAAQNKWMPIVVRNEWCPMLTPFVEKYGVENTIAAIEYLMDSNLWESPKGNTHLKSQKIETYQTFTAIDDAVTYLLDEGKIQPYVPTPVVEAETEAETENAVPILEFVDAEMEEQYREDPGASRCLIMDTYDCISEIDKFTDLMRKNLAKVLTHIEWEAEQQKTDMQKEAERLRKEKTRLELVLKEKNETIKKLRDDNNQSQQNYVKKSQEHDEQKRIIRQQADTIQIKSDELAAVKKELNDLRKTKEQFDALPKRKVLKMSELDEIPMVGKTVKYGLLPWLEKNGIYIDPNK